MTFYGRWVYKYEEAARRGAIAALVVHETDAAGYPWTVVKSPAGESYNDRAAGGRAAAGAAAGWIQQSRRGGLLKRAGYDYATVKRAGADRGVQADRPQGEVHRRHPGRRWRGSPATMCSAS